jgi:hypothetical protein
MRRLVGFWTNFVLTCFICVHRRSSAANIGFDFRVRPNEKHIWPPMNADERR